MHTTTEAPKFNPTPDMIKLAEACFTAMAYEQHVRAIVESYQRKILVERKYKIREEFRAGILRRDGAVEDFITDPSVSYLMSDEDFADYDSRCDQERVLAGLSIEKPGQCPLLVAECLTREAKHALVDTMAPVTGMTSAQIISQSLLKYKQIEELVLKLYSAVVATSPQILSRITGQKGATTRTVQATA